ncbi:tail tube [Yersinia phage fHe-Yen9-02]|nr:tail tube [Yersinia phage fHe-Yen9-02]
MSKVTLDEFASTADPLLDDNFEFLIPNPPIGGSDYARSLRIMCKTGVKPGSTVEEVLKEAFGHQLNYAGRKIFTHSLSTEYNENAEMAIYKPIEEWHDLIRATETQLGAVKADYAVKAIFRIFKQDGSIAAEYDIYGVWPKQVPDLTFSGAAQAVPVTIEWSFDYALKVS